MPLERRQIEQALATKGFDLEEGAKHRRFLLLIDGKKTGVATQVSRGSGKKYKTLSDELVSRMAKQVKLTKKEFEDFVSCAMDEASYKKLVQEQRGVEV